MKRTKFLVTILMGMVFISFPSCNGTFDDIYDNPKDKTEEGYGFKNVNLASKSGTVYIDASSYTRWIYLNFHERTVDSMEIDSNNKEPEKWDLAVHRYDTRVAGEGVIETEYTDLDMFMSSGKMPTGAYSADVDGDITIDMSGMMDGNIITCKSKVNPVLSLWLDVDTSVMPPIYTLSNKVYLVKFSDGSIAAVKLVDFRNKKFDKGFLTIDYIYPVEF